MGELTANLKRQAAGEGEDHRHQVLGDVGSMYPAVVGQDDAAGGHLGDDDVFDPGANRLNPAEIGSGGDLLGTDAPTDDRVGPRQQRQEVVVVGSDRDIEIGKAIAKSLDVLILKREAD